MAKYLKKAAAKLKTQSPAAITSIETTGIASPMAPESAANGAEAMTPALGAILPAAEDDGLARIDQIERIIAGAGPCGYCGDIVFQEPKETVANPFEGIDLQGKPYTHIVKYVRLCHTCGGAQLITKFENRADPIIPPQSQTPDPIT